MRVLPALVSFTILATGALAWAAGAAALGPTSDTHPWVRSRGVNVGAELTERDVADLAALGGDLIRLSLPVTPLMDLEPPHALNEDAFAFVEKVLDWSEAHGVRVLIDPHRFPGTEHQWTMLASDPFWTDFSWHDKAIRVWEEIARRCARRGEVIAGYDLLNEPAIALPMEKGTPKDLNLLYAKLIAAIRAHDTRHTIVVAAPRFRLKGQVHSYNEGTALLELPDDDNLCVEVHMYQPMEFSHQGVAGRPMDRVPYPGVIEGERWDRARVEKAFEPVAVFVQRTGLPILVGEFSCPRWLGDSGNAYLRDIIETAEANGWSWAYHAWREYHAWDPELSNTDPEDRSRHATTPRVELLKGYFARGRH